MDASPPPPSDAHPSPELPVSREYAPRERLRVSIELTNVCNFSCPICPQAFWREEEPAGAPFDRPRGHMAPEVFRRAVAECQRVADTVELGFFGEQTLHKRYVEYLRGLRDRRFVLEVSTNLSLVTRETMAAWVEAGVDLVRFSIDALTPEVFDRARPGSVRDMAGRPVAGPERLKAIEDKARYWLAQPEHRPTRLVFVRSSHNRGEEEPFVEYWRRALGPEDRVLTKQVLSYGGKIADPEVRAHRCNVWDVRFLMIDWRGVVSPCNLDTNMDLALGSVMEQSIDALYRGPVAEQLRGATGCGRDLTPCRTCVDGNNWSRNAVFANPVQGEGPRPALAAAARARGPVSAG